VTKDKPSGRSHRKARANTPRVETAPGDGPPKAARGTEDEPATSNAKPEIEPSSAAKSAPSDAVPESGDVPAAVVQETEASGALLPAPRLEESLTPLPPATAGSLSQGERLGDGLEQFFLADSEREKYAEPLLSEGAEPGPLTGHALAELLSFSVADEEYAIEIVEIQEIIKVPSITEVPRGPAGVLGIISLRGTIVPVIDLRALLRLDFHPLSKESRILVVRVGEVAAGLLVDRVTSVVRLDRDAIEPVPRTLEHGATELLRGVGHVGDRLLIVLDLAAVVGSMEISA
jgi:purine-binding chemotaxis protein CheW